MSEVDRARLKVALSRHYAAQREGAAREDAETVAQLMVEEDARARRMRPRSAGLGLAAFVAAQARYIPAWTWAAHIALVALMCLMAYAAGDTGATKVAVGMLSAVTVLVGVPTVVSSKRHGVAELEYACPNNAASVLVARLIVLGCSSALAVALMVAATASSAGAGAFEVALWAVPPYFLSCAGSLMALRKAPPSTAPALCAVWTLACCGALVVFASSLPDMYARASLAVWAGAAAGAGAWLAREVLCTYRAAARGLDAFSPHMARTCN